MKIFIFAFIRGIPSSANIMYLVFLTPKQKFTCVTPSGWTATNDQCFMRPSGTINGTLIGGVLPCSQWTYDRSIYAGITMVEQSGAMRRLPFHWNLVCSQRWMVSTTQSVYWIGVVCGNFIFAHVGDWYGRKRSTMIALIWSAVTGTLMAFAASIVYYSFFRFLTAVGTTGYYEACLLLVIEALSPAKRYIVTLTIGLGHSCGMVLVPVTAHLLTDWNLVHLAPPVIVAILLMIWTVVSGLLWYHSSVSTAGVSDHPFRGFALAALFESPAKLLNVLFIK
ncbi:solute carrier family 22 member 6-like [Galendromus occidentalis]|uniref:Solute carrier family 22 member 6-like n=1 Tax=Galendromus occidentalis TaxID=34638 RepID=A0AAJ6VY07_9ACAR|nr:solute carrier family 22 member 6-like [Galendromus occidentalis]